MNGPDQTFLDAAAALLGPRGFTQDPDLLAPWQTDWRGRYTGQACALASPADAAEVAKLMRLCAAHRVAIVPQGGNSGMSGGATPDASGRQLLLSLRRLDTIGPVDVEARQVTCGAGVILQHLHTAAEQAGLRFPLSLGGKGSATVGGLISTNAGGTQVLRHGSMRAMVLGIEAVLADGSRWTSLTPLKKDNRGFDLKQLFIGAEGTLGVVTAATLALAPALAGRRVVWAGVGSIEQARKLLVLADRAAGTTLEGFEVIPDSCLHAVLAHLPQARAPLAGSHAWHALIELASEDPDCDLDALALDLLEQAAGQTLLEDATIAASEGQAEAFWTLRESISAALRAKGAAVQHDIAVPVPDMAGFIAMAIPVIEAEFPGCRAFAFGHLGDGNVHFHVTGPAGAVRGEWEEAQGKAASRRVHDLVTQWHGTISAEHGIGQMKRDELARLGDPVGLAIMASVKAALDPLELMNPGKLLALAPGGSSA
ncbi:FAD-binding oxidoreductase [Novosphingobium sp.]|uniref:FAD-binding oxidoreductase n=1 Tax=Novosphingobium sp. TaxID=1874826 RepID=UPI0025E4BEC2|nr:FAD-binding oxidoreductase [Novosphingobium sp.]MCC6925449.1 FAD-binding oxidoreductase [Novosphingobium sp.]